jgi:hypothetical protein
MVKWVSDSPTQVKAANAPFMLTLSEDSLQWSITYQESEHEDWRTLGGHATLDRTEEEVHMEYVPNRHHSEREDIGFWMRLKKINNNKE